MTKLASGEGQPPSPALDPKIVAAFCRYAGGYWLAIAPESITVADIARVIDGPLADVHGMSPEVFGPPGVAAPTKQLWIAVRAALRSVMEQVTIADLAAGVLPAAVAALLAMLCSARCKRSNTAHSNLRHVCVWLMSNLKIIMD